jgi:hypothetical protein
MFATMPYEGLIRLFWFAHRQTFTPDELIICNSDSQC